MNGLFGSRVLQIGYAYSIGTLFGNRVGANMKTARQFSKQAAFFSIY